MDRNQLERPCGEWRTKLLSQFGLRFRIATRHQESALVLERWNTGNSDQGLIHLDRTAVQDGFTDAVPEIRHFESLGWRSVSVMNSPSIPQITGNVCAGLAVALLLFPLRNVMWEYSRKYLSDDRWVAPTLYILTPLWLLLLVALLCVTSRGGFDWLPLGRTSLYVLTALAAFALAALTFIFIGLHIRPGFTPRHLYSPVIYLVPLSTVLLVVLSLNPSLTAGASLQWLRIPWALLAGLSLALGGGFLGVRGFRGAVGAVAFVADRISNPGPSAQEILARVSALDPVTDFDDLLRSSRRYSGRQIRDAAISRLRSNPHFLERLSTELESGDVEPALAFVLDAELSRDELARLARPSRRALERWVGRIPAPNYTTKKHLKDLKNWGKVTISGISEKFAGTGVDFTAVREEFQEKVGASR